MSKAEIVYLAVGNKQLVMNGESAEFDFYHCKDKKKTELWLCGDDEENNTVLTALVAYEDNDWDWGVVDEDYSKGIKTWYETTLQGKLTKLSNEGSDEYWVEVFELFETALCKLDNKTFKEVYKRLEGLRFYSRPVDFAMHEPTDDYIHTKYDT